MWMKWIGKLTSTNGIALFVSLSIFSFIPGLQQSLLANHGKEIIIEFNNGQYLILPDKKMQQVKLTATYSIEDSEWVGKQISGIMRVYTQNETLIKTTSIPNGFRADESGFQQFVTSIPNSSIQTITAVVLFTELNQTSPLSNSITENLVLNKTRVR